MGNEKKPVYAYVDGNNNSLYQKTLSRIEKLHKATGKPVADLFEKAVDLLEEAEQQSE